MKVQENVTVDADGAVIFPNSSDVNSPSTSGTIKCSDNGTNEATPTSINNPCDPSSSASTLNPTQQNIPQSEQNHEKTPHYNNLNNSNDCLSQHRQQVTPTQLSSSQQHNNPLWWRENLNLDKSKLILIGFSKGCVVLNQVSPYKRCKNRNLYKYYFIIFFS